MHAIVIREPGGPDVLAWVEVPDPAPAPGEVLVDIVASAVNRADLMQRAGFYPPPPGAPPYPGLECSGRIAEVGHTSRHLLQPVLREREWAQSSPVKST